MREEAGGVEDEEGAVMSAISVLVVQSDNSVQFLPESKIFPSGGFFTFGGEKLVALSAAQTEAGRHMTSSTRRVSFHKYMHKFNIFKTTYVL